MQRAHHVAQSLSAVAAVNDDDLPCFRVAPRDPVQQPRFGVADAQTVNVHDHPVFFLSDLHASHSSQLYYTDNVPENPFQRAENMLKFVEFLQLF